MSSLLYDILVEDLGAVERGPQRRATDLLIELSDAEDEESYSISAPTGTGKSYAALLAGVHNARSGKERRTVIGTSTLLLSDQYETDARLVEKSFPDVKFFVLKGSKHYYCGRKAQAAIKQAKSYSSPNRLESLLQSLSGLKNGTSISIPTWCSSDTEHCSDCISSYKRTFKTSCDYARARQEALNADVVITTHAMIAADLRVRIGSNEESNVLGEVWLTIFDEAHKASEALVYKDTFGVKKLDNLFHARALDGIGFDRRAEFRKFIEEEGEEYGWYTCTQDFGKRMQAKWLAPWELATMKPRLRLAPDKDRPGLRSSVSFLERAYKVLGDMAEGNNSGGEALWFSRGLYKMQDMLPEGAVIERLNEMRVAWMSATIGSHSRPTYSIDKCGIETKHFELETAFDFEKQLSYLVKSEKEMSEIDILNSVNSWWPGGMVVLTPFHDRKESITSKLRMVLPGEVVQDQAKNGTGVNSSGLNAEFMKGHLDSASKGGNPVLVGVDVFSTGVDLPGAALTKLVVAGLFPLRDDHAYIVWRCRWLESLGWSGFDGFLLPERAITLEQQIGRVIRRETDEGRVVFYLSNKDAAPGSEGRKIVAEALKKFYGAKELV